MKAALVGLLVVLVAPGAYSAPPIQKQSLALFPFAIGSGIPTSRTELVQEYADDLLALVNEGLTQTQRYSVVLFDPKVASLKRAVLELQITEKELAQPIDTTFEGTAKAQKLAKVMGTDLAVIGCVEDFTFDDKTGDAALIVTTQMIDVRTGKVDPVIVTGKAKKAEDKPDQTEQAIGISATYDAAERLLANVASVSSTELTGTPGSQAPAPKSKKSKGFIPAMLGAVLLGFLLSGG